MGLSEKVEGILLNRRAALTAALTAFKNPPRLGVSP